MQKGARETASGLAAQGKALQLAEPLGTTAREVCHWIQRTWHIIMQLAKDVTSDTSICWEAAKATQSVVSGAPLDVARLYSTQAALRCPAALLGQLTSRHSEEVEPSDSVT